MIQSHCQLIKCLSLPIELIPMDSYVLGFIPAEIKPRTCLGVSDLNLFTQPKLKTYLHKDASTNINNLLKYEWEIILK